jgi:hypothetical protein
MRRRRLRKVVMLSQVVIRMLSSALSEEHTR